MTKFLRTMSIAAVALAAGLLCWHIETDEGFGGFCTALAFVWLTRDGRTFLDDEEGWRG